MGITIRRCQIHKKWQFYSYEGFLPCCLYSEVARLRTGINGILQARSFLRIPVTSSRREIAELTLDAVNQIGRGVLHEVPVTMGRIPKPPKPVAAPAAPIKVEIPAPDEAVKPS